MKSLREALVHKHMDNPSVDRRKMIQYAKDALEAMDTYSDSSLEDQYTAAYENICRLSCVKDPEIRDMAEAALESDTEDMEDRLDEFTEVIEKISWLK